MNDSTMDIAQTSLNDSNDTNTSRENQYYGSSVFDLLPVSYRNARIFLYNYLVIIIWIVSILGNSLVILVLMKKKNRGFSTSIYLKGLAVADLSLNTSNTFTLYFLAHGYIKPPTSDADCHYRNVFSFAIAYIATWMLVVISLERVMSVWMPFKVKRLCTANTAYIVIVFTWILFLGLAFLHERFMAYSSLTCQIKEEYLELYVEYVIWVLITVKYFIPYAIILVCSFIIMSTLLRRKIRKHSTEKRNRGTSVNIALLSVNIVFLLTNSPYIFFYLHTDYGFFDPDIYLSYAYYQFWSVYLKVVNDCNSAVNVFVYFLVGSRFRADVKEMLFGCIPNDRAGIMKGIRNELKTRSTTLLPTEVSAHADDLISSTPKLMRRQESQFSI
ncbi:C-C chemokine receptor type 1-like [Mercenaria mercenaria]|uniref:C-C chemokine receptor type 1-like n=1 Tax=Mercenaria mercenaria TaxID=6596 RepID=UPI00234F701F|nr:C-C chemokine receptor type 1-like [Mercenaria mercenaria]